MLLQDFESLIDRGVLSFRSKRLDTVVSAIEVYLASGGATQFQAVQAAVESWQRQDPLEFGNRLKNRKDEFLEALRAESSKALGKGRIPLYDASCHPAYQPHLWNDPVTRESTNCYAYACDDRLNHKAGETQRPGFMAGRDFENFEGHLIRQAVLQDDMKRIERQKQRLKPLVRLRDDIENNAEIEVANIPGHYLIALVVSQGHDFHWYRQDNTGYWSHKPGTTDVTDLDRSHKKITDPRVCNMGSYRFVCFYYAPKGGVQTMSLGDYFEDYRQLMEKSKRLRQK